MVVRPEIDLDRVGTDGEGRNREGRLRGGRASEAAVDEDVVMAVARDGIPAQVLAI